jgi:hypothetical protein
MATATCILSGTFLDPTGDAIVGATVRFNVESPVIDNTGAYILSPKEVTTTTASDGSWSLTLSQGASGSLSLDCPPDATSSTQRYSFSVQVPTAASSTFISAWTDQTNAASYTPPFSFASISGQLQTAQLPALPAGYVWVGNSLGLAAAVSITGDVGISSTGAATVNSVGGTTASNVASGTALALAATNANTVSTIVKRDASGNFSAGTITAALTGAATTFTGSLTGDVTSSGMATTIGTNKVVNTMLAQMATKTLKGNNGGSTANAADLTVTQTNSMLYVAPTVQSFTSSSGTYTKPANCLWIRVRMVGGGGGGGASGSGTGTTGGNTTFGTTLLVANGGVGGVGGSNGGGAGGSASLGSGPIGTALSGGSGTAASGVAGSSIAGGSGAASAFGGQGGGGAATVAGSAAIANTGSGGGGGGGTTNAGGGGGAGGFVDAIITSPLSTYSYAVGASGAGGSTTGNAGGAGGSGYIIVEEYYQ